MNAVPVSAPSPAATARAARTTLAVLALIAGADAFGYAMILPILPLIAERLGLPIVAIGVVFACYSLCQVIAAPVIGTLGDRYGVKRLVLLCQCGTIVGFALLFHLAAPWLLFVSRIVDGTTAGNVSLLYGTVIKALPPERHRGGFATLATATSVGIFFGLISAAFVVRFGFDTLVAVVVAASFVILLVTARWYPHTPVRRDREGYVSLRTIPRILTGRVLAFALAAVLAFTTLQAAFLTTLPVLLERLRSLDAAGITRFLVVLFLVAALFQLGILTLMNRWLPTRAVALAAFVLVIGGSLVYASAWQGALTVGAGLVMGGCALLGPALSAVLGQFTATLHAGTVMGLNQAAASLGQLLGPFIGYIALALGSTVAPRIILAILAAVGIGLLLAAKEDRHATAR
jgi:DHA1 family tetracycline resistance protein-like MFS transporter